MRYCLAVLLSLLILLPTTSQAALPTKEFLATQEFTARVARLERKSGGRLGVAVMLASGTPLFAYRAGERFAICSTFKVLLGAFMLARVDAHRESLARPIFYKSSNLLDYAPITKQHVRAGHMTVAELNAAAIEYSDNTAANLLLDSVGGPKALTKYLRSIGDSTTRLDRNETSLNTNLPGDLRDTSTPAAMAKTLHKLLAGTCLAPASKAQLKAWMVGNTTGASKLRSGFDKSWGVGDKTGSGENGASNDVAIVLPRGLPPFIITVFYTGSAASTDTKSAVIAEVARITSDALLNRGHSKTKSSHNLLVRHNK